MEVYWFIQNLLFEAYTCCYGWMAKFFWFFAHMYTPGPLVLLSFRLCKCIYTLCIRVQSLKRYSICTCVSTCGCQQLWTYRHTFAKCTPYACSLATQDYSYISVKYLRGALTSLEEYWGRGSDPTPRHLPSKPIERSFWVKSRNPGRAPWVAKFITSRPSYGSGIGFICSCN